MIRTHVTNPLSPRYLRKSERGATLIEFAITSILFFVLIFGIAEFGRAIWLYGTIGHGAREGARYAMVHGSESTRPVDDDTDVAGPPVRKSVQTYVRERAPGLQNATVTTTWSQPAGCGETPCKKASEGAAVKVRVQVTFDPVLWFMPSIPLSTTSEMTLAF
jgi:Flp pilus assembly protein TadG